jgi:SnoaL-like domain
MEGANPRRQSAKIDVVTTPTDETTDVVALMRLLATYADIATRRAWPELSTCFLADLEIVVDTITNDPYHFKGRQEFIDFVGPQVEQYDHFEFVILNNVVELTGPDEARSRMFMCEVRHEISINEWNNAYGVYQDTFKRIDGVWWFADRRYRSIGRTGVNTAIFGVKKDMDLFAR